jgi:hypothetical protein
MIPRVPVTEVTAPWLLQALGPSAVLDAPASVRAVVAFLLTLLFGGGVLYRYGGRIDEAVDASRGRPVVSVLYGLVAYALVSFVVVYAYSQLVRLGVGTTVLAVLAAVVLVGFFLSLGGLGFVVVAVWATETFGFRDPWVGLLGVGLVAAVALFVLPAEFGLLVWLAIAAVGVGGPTRRWIHAGSVDAGAG